MKFYVDSVCVLELSPVQEQILLSGIPADAFVQTMEQKVIWVVTQGIDGSFNNLFNKWLPILQGRYESLPSNPDKFAELIFSQPDYKPAATPETI